MACRSVVFHRTELSETDSICGKGCDEDNGFHLHSDMPCIGFHQQNMDGSDRTGMLSYSRNEESDLHKSYSLHHMGYHPSHSVVLSSIALLSLCGRTEDFDGLEDE